ncbi:centlein [Passer montanus]|uniref:centlein n=1 Tax=Passer montanus TaxID=9160 RepID=UPI0019609CEC|nr:centlein [Passer montanus]
MASGCSEAATQRVAELEEELRALAEQLSRCQADKEFVWSLWKHLQVSKPDLTQAVSLVVPREKRKAEVKDRSILKVLQDKDSEIESLEQRLTGQQQEINSLMQRKNAVDEENTRLKNEFGYLNRKFKDKSQELKDTEECAQKKEEQNRLVIKNLEEENKGLNICCADLLSDLEKLRKQETQWKKEKSGSDTRIKNLETNLAETREQIKSLHCICSNLSSQVDVKQEERFQKDCDVVGAEKELEELQNLYRQNTEDRTQQAELIKQLEALNADTQEALQAQEYAHTAKTTYQKIITLTIRIGIATAFKSARDYITMQESEMELLQKKLKEVDLNLAEHNLYTTDTLESSNIRTGRKHKEPPVKCSRSLSPKSSFRESEESQESYELRAAYGKHEERLQMLQPNYRVLKEQLKQWEEGNSSLENSKSRYQHTGSCQLCQEDPDVMWDELAFFKREYKKWSTVNADIKATTGIQMSEYLEKDEKHVQPLFKLSEDDAAKANASKRCMREVSYKMLQKVQQLERRFKAIEGELKKQKEVNKDLLNEKMYLKESLKLQKEDADPRKRELETVLKRICEVKKEKAELQFLIDEKEKEAASLKRQVTEANRLRNESEDLLSQVQEQKCLLDKSKAVAISGQYNCKITGTKVKLKTAKKRSSLGHHGAFLKQSIKVMSNVFENFSKDGWEDMSESRRGPAGCVPGLKRLPTILNRAKGRNTTIQKLGYSVTLLQKKIKPLKKQVAVVQRKKKTTVSSIKNVTQNNDKLTSQLHLPDQTSSLNKWTIPILASSLAKWQLEKKDLQGKLKLREHLSQTAGKSEATPAPSKNIDLEIKQLQCKLKNSNTEIAKQSTTIKSLKKQVQEKEEWVQELQAKISKLERAVTMKRQLIGDLMSCLKANQENKKTSNETLESLERKTKALAEDKKASIDSMKQRFNVAMKEKSQYEQMYHKAKDDLEKKDLRIAKLERKVIETECALSELETAASQQLYGLAKQNTQALETLQKELLLTSDKVEEFKTFVKSLTGELHHSVQELRTKIKLAKKVEEMKACKKGLSQESFQLAASILNVSTSDLYQILQEGDDEETAETEMEFEKDKEWLQHIQKLSEGQFPFASYLMDAVLEKLNEKKKLVEEYSSLMKHTV